MIPNASTATSRRGIFYAGRFFLIAWYVGLCLWHFFSQRPLWNDEACVFQSIKYFDAVAMFSKPLMSIQVFPRAYLFCIQRFSRLFDYHLLSLRFFPLLAMLTAFGVWMRLARREWSGGWPYGVFILSWSASALLIYYAAELKPYSMDVLAASLFIWFIVEEVDLKEHLSSMKYRVVLAGLPALGLVSYPAFLFALIVLYNLILTRQRKRQGWRDLIIYCLALGFFLALSYVFDMRFRHVTDVTSGFGDYFISFASVGEFFKTFQEGTLNLFIKWLVIRPRIVKKIATFFMAFGLLYMFYGFNRHIKRDGFMIKSLHTLPMALYLELVCLGALKIYPFTVPRTSLFFAPLVMFMVVEALRSLIKWKPPVGYLISGLYGGFLFFLALSLTRVLVNGPMGFEPVIF